MLGLAIRNLFARKFRAISTASSVFFGVSMISGTLFIAESVNRSFDNLFGEVNAGIDVTVREATVVDDPFDQGPQAGFEDSLLETVQEVDGVETAEGVIADVRISILGDDGERIGPPSGGPPHIALSTVETDAFDALTLVDGEGPDAPDEVAIDADSAEDENFEIGDTVTITGDAGASEYTIVGLTQFGSGETSLGASLAQFTLEEAQRLTGKEGRYDEIDISAEEGTTPEELAARVQEAVGPKFDVMTGQETAEEDAGDITEGFSFLTTGLLVFAGISVFVGGFLIFNTFSITVVQRTKEFAMLRTLGASSRQVLGAVLTEAALIGVLASLLGIAGGFVFVELIKLTFQSSGFELPVTSLRLTFDSVFWPLLVGILSTIVAAMIPAVRATRVAPLEALREGGGSTEIKTRTSRIRTIIAGVLLTLAVVLLGLGLFVTQDETGALLQMGGGLVLLFIAPRDARQPVRASDRERDRRADREAAWRHGAPGARERTARAPAHGHDRRGADDRSRARRVRRGLLGVDQVVAERSDRRADRGRSGGAEQGRLLPHPLAHQRGGRRDRWGRGRRAHREPACADRRHRRRRPDHRPRARGGGPGLQPGLRRRRRGDAVGAGGGRGHRRGRLGRGQRRRNRRRRDAHRSERQPRRGNGRRERRGHVRARRALARHPARYGT